MTPQDAGEAVRILRAWIDDTPWMPMLHDPDDMQTFWARRLCEAEGLAVDGPAGLAGFLVREGETIAALYVDRLARETGVGSALLEAARHASSRLRLWTFVANTRAQAFYRHHGFCEVSRTDGANEEGLPDVQMEWSR